MSNFCPPPPDAGIILEVVHFFLRTCFYTILDSSTNFSRKKVTNFAAHHHNVCSCSQKLSAIIIKQRPSRSACSFMQARHVMIMDQNCVKTINYIEVHMYTCVWKISQLIVCICIYIVQKSVNSLYAQGPQIGGGGTLSLFVKFQQIHMYFCGSLLVMC